MDGALSFLTFDPSSWADAAKWLHTCDHFNDEAECHEYIEEAFEIILKELHDLKRESLAKEWCTHWGSCTEEEAANLSV